jgi:transcriptional regulator with XRE-family HTH domain
MSRDRSFAGYVKSRFYDPIYSAVDDFVEQSWESFDLRISNVHNIGGVAMSDMEIKFVSVGDLPGLKIEFDVVVDAEIEVSEGDYHYDDYDICNQWLTVRCAGDLACSLDDFQIVSIAVYQKGQMSKPLSDALVPYIYKEDLESEALNFLQRYYPEALKTPMAVEPLKLAQKMGLQVAVREITEDLSIFGQIYFQDSDAEFYDPGRGELVKTAVEARTIIVDPNVFFLRNLGAVNNTIVHECVHWDKHRKAFELERLYNGSVTKIKCQVVGGIKDDERNATDWMEWQANSLAPRIQMPLGPFKTKAHEFIKTFQKELGTTDLIYVMEPVIDALATFFCVSRLAAKIRMIDAGYEEAVGTFTYIDDRYVKPHRFKKGVLERNQTFCISAIDAAIQSLAHPEIKNGNYLYIDFHFVLDHPKYVTVNLLGETVLTRYARTHMDECCLIFDLSVQTGGKERYFTECFLNRDESSNITFRIEYNHGYQHAAPEKQSELLLGVLRQETEIYRQLTTDYRDCLNKAREWRKVTYEELGERIFMDESAARRIINGQTQGSINTLVLICLALHLPPKISKHIIDCSPHSFNFHNESHVLYEFALTHLYSQPLEHIFAFLEQHGAEPL